MRASFAFSLLARRRPVPYRSPEGIWVGIESGKTLDLTFLPEADLEARMTAAP